jgi:DNA-binding transcriptional regulator YiaG
LRTVGDQVRHRRLEFGWTQEQTAKWFGVTESTIWNWESGGITPNYLFRTVVRVFLGDPLADASLPDKLRFLRWVLGVTQRELADKLCVNPSTVEDWETGTCGPNRSNRERIMKLIERSEPSRRGGAAGGRATENARGEQLSLLVRNSRRLDSG